MKVKETWERLKRDLMIANAFRRGEKIIEKLGGENLTTTVICDATTRELIGYSVEVQQIEYAGNGLYKKTSATYTIPANGIAGPLVASEMGIYEHFVESREVTYVDAKNKEVEVPNMGEQGRHIV